MSDSRNDGGVDLAGLGEIAKAIPPQVYDRTATTVLTTFVQLIAPITATTSGLGRYLSQKFDNMVEVERAVVTYAIEAAMTRAERRMNSKGGHVVPPPNTKVFVRSLEEVSQEPDARLHEMWVNLITCQLSEGVCHPHFVETLAHFSAAEAKLLDELGPENEVGENGGRFISVGELKFEHWLPKANAERRPWSIACSLLYDFGFVNFLAPKDQNDKATAILYRTRLGSAFLASVSSSVHDAEPSTLGR